MMKTQDSLLIVPKLLQKPIQTRNGKQPVRLLACGGSEGVNSIVYQLHILNFAEVTAWSPPLPSPVKGEVMRILTRHVTLEKK